MHTQHIRTKLLKRIQWLFNLNQFLFALPSLHFHSTQCYAVHRGSLELHHKQSCFDQINPKRIFFFNHLSFQIISVPMQPNNIWHFARKKSERNALGFEFDGRGFCTAGNTKGFYIELILLINWIFDQWEEFWIETWNYSSDIFWI